MFDIAQALKTLPQKPGVYIMHDKDDNIIYVGKAKILKNRVKQYFVGKNHPPKVSAMVENIAYFEYIIADSELEALILENNLIKRYMPKYNILLKDDKTYPFLKITMNEDFPRLIMTRTVKKDGAKYFGPYQSGIVLRDLIELIREIFKIRCCNKTFTGDYKAQKPCLYHHIGKCVGVCSKNISKEKYREIINNIILFLNGNYDKIYKSLNDEMRLASHNLDFEKAAVLRDRIKSIEILSQKQKIVTANGNDIDAISLYNNNNLTCVEVFFIRSGNMIGKEHYFIENTAQIDNGEILSDFLLQYYDTSSFIPREIFLRYEIEDAKFIGKILSDKAGRNVLIRTPKIGENARLMAMIDANAKKEHSEYELKKMSSGDFLNDALSSLEKLLSLDNPPMLIEAYDISNISGTDKVGSLVTFKNGKKYKEGYKNFKIKTVDHQDDYASMEEVLTRRFKRYIDSDDGGQNGFSILPDVIFLDGGKTHVSIGVKALKSLGVDVPIFGIVKDDNHNTRGLVTENDEIPLEKGSSAFMLLANIQDEMHRRAITYHRNLRNTRMTESELTKIDGVGESRKKALLNHFKSFSKIKKASLEELASVKGISRKTAENIYKYFNKE